MFESESYGMIAHYPGATLLSIRRRRSVQYHVRRKYQRGGIRGFSRKSRTRLMCLLNRVTEKAWADARVITLTYHHGKSISESKADLNCFLQWLRDRYSAVHYVWKTERQIRGAIHFHLVVWGTGYIPRTDIAFAWNRIAEPGDQDHLTSGSQIRKLRSPRRNRKYLCKYLCKLDVHRERCNERSESEPAQEKEGLHETDVDESLAGDQDSHASAAKGVGRVWGTDRRFTVLCGTVCGIRIPYVVADAVARYFSNVQTRTSRTQSRPTADVVHLFGRSARKAADFIANLDSRFRGMPNGQATDQMLGNDDFRFIITLVRDVTS